MGKSIKVHEPITSEQLKLLHSAPSGDAAGEWSESALYAEVEALAGIPFISALSKQEAIFLIDLIKGKGGRRRYPAGAIGENEIEGDTSTLPSYYHIRDIRQWFKELGWSKEHISSWLLKSRKVTSIRALDRSNAHGTWFALRAIVTRAKGKA